MNYDYVVKTRARRADNRYTELIKSEGWDTAYKEMSGDKAYIEGSYNGYNHGYNDACEELRNHIKFILSRVPDVTVKDLINYIIIDT